MRLYNYKDNSYQIYFEGIIEEKNINFLEKKQKKILSQAALSFIEKKWQEAVKKDPTIYNGTLLDVLSVESRGDLIEIANDYTDYKISLVTRSSDYSPFIKEGNYSSNHLSIAPLIKTQDNKIIIGSDLTFKNKLQSWRLPGGYFDPAVDKTILDCIQRELSEELGAYTVANNKIIGISKNLNHNFTLMTCLIDCPKTSDEIIAINNNSKEILKDYEEMQIIKFIDFDKEKIQELLSHDLISLSPSTTISFKLLELNM